MMMLDSAQTPAHPLWGAFYTLFFFKVLLNEIYVLESLHHLRL